MFPCSKVTHYTQWSFDFILISFRFHFDFCLFDPRLFRWRSLHIHGVEQLQHLYSLSYPAHPLLCDQLSAGMLPGKQRQPTHGKPHLQLHRPNQTPKPPSSISGAIQHFAQCRCFPKVCSGCCSLQRVLKMCQLIPGSGLISRGADSSSQLR